MTPADIRQRVKQIQQLASTSSSASREVAHQLRAKLIDDVWEAVESGQANLREIILALVPVGEE